MGRGKVLRWVPGFYPEAVLWARLTGQRDRHKVGTAWGKVEAKRVEATEDTKSHPHYEVLVS